MKERKIIAKPIGIQVGIEPTITMSKEPDFTVDAETGRVEWSSGLTSAAILALRQILKVEKPNLIVWNSLKRHIDNGISQREIARINKGVKGYSMAQIKRFSAAYSRLKSFQK